MSEKHTLYPHLLKHSRSLSYEWIFTCYFIMHPQVRNSEETDSHFPGELPFDHLIYKRQITSWEFFVVVTCDALPSCSYLQCRVPLL